MIIFGLSETLLVMKFLLEPCVFSVKYLPLQMESYTRKLYLKPVKKIQQLTSVVTFPIRHIVFYAENYCA